MPCRVVSTGGVFQVLLAAYVGQEASAGLWMCGRPAITTVET